MKRLLGTSLLTLILAASALAASEVWILLVAALLLTMLLGVLAWQLGNREGLGIVLVSLALVVFVLIAANIAQPRISTRSGQCRSDLHQIALALLAYEHANGAFPPAYVAGPDGKPWHSWRVLLLPFMDSQFLYKTYDLNEPWDSPKNCQLAAMMPPYWFRCPSAPYADDKPPRMTNLVAVTGPGTAWPGPKSTRLSDFGDDPGKTILLVEIADSDIPWMEPRDLSLEELLAQNTAGQPASKNRAADSHSLEEPPGARGAWVVMADAGVHFLPAGFSLDQFKALATINGGEDVSLPDPAPRNAWQRLSWVNRVGLAFFVVSLVALARQAFRRPRDPISSRRAVESELT
jgi:hypothetical protein